jgi:hypothetical protein
MSNFTQFVGGGGGATPIGQLVPAFANGDTFTDSTGATYLCTGKTVLPSAAPIAALLPHMQVFGLPSMLPLNITTTGMAVDSTGSYYVVTYGDATNVLVSQNSGKTWAAVPHGMAGTANDVAWGAGVFVVVGGAGNASLVTAVSANNGSTFTASTIPAPGAFNGSSRIAFGNNMFVATIPSTNSSYAVATAPATGTGFTFQASPQATTNGPAQVAYCAAAGLWLIQNDGGGAAYFTSPTCATGTYTARTFPGSMQNPSSVGNAVIAIDASGYNIYRTVDGVNWTNTTPVYGNLTQGNPTYTGKLRSNSGGAMAFLSLTNFDQSFFTTTDGQSWVRRWNAVNVGGAINTSSWFLGAGNSLVALPANGSSTAMYSNTFLSTCDLVGSTTRLYYSYVSGASYNGPMAYVRIC